ncbi:MAG: HEAT repeat domain-containing protein [Deltaproteobacteria bacterium]|nr:MAG: HEAT repeat domain-containing protein [Deltaproteobacteria bacterium]
MSNSMTIPIAATSPSADELRSFLRQIRSNLHIHKHQPPDHPMQAKALHLLHQQLTNLTSSYGPLSLRFDGHSVQVNGSSLEDFLTPEQQNEVASVFLDHNIQNLTFTTSLTQADLGKLFANLFEDHRSYEHIPSSPTLQALLPSIGINQHEPKSDANSPIITSPKEQGAEQAAEFSTPAIASSSPSLTAQPQVGSGSHSSYHSLDHQVSPSSPSGFGPLPEDPSGLVPLPPMPLLEQTQRGSQPDLGGMDLPSWLRSKEALSTFHQWFAAQSHLSGQLETNSLSGPKAVQASYVVQDIRGIHRRIQSLRHQATSQDVTDRITQLTFQQLSNLSPSLWVQHLVVLLDPSGPQQDWALTLLHASNTHSMQRLMHALFLRVEADGVPPEQSNLLHVVRECVNHLYEQGQEDTLLGFLRDLNTSNEEQPSPHRQSWQTVVQSFVTEPSRLEALFAQARQPGADSSQQLLAQLCTESLPFGIFQLPQIRNLPSQEQQVALLLLISYYAPPHHCEIALRKVLSTLDTLPDLETQEFCFSLCCQFAPTLLESYIFQRLSTLQDARLRRRLLQQAVASNTPRMRLLLKQLLEQNNFTHEPEQEEWLLHYLYEHKGIDVLRFLQGRIYNPDNPYHVRHHAVWMLGSFPNKKSLQFLEQVLLHPPVESETWKSLQLQAVHTLGRMPFSEAWSLLRDNLQHFDLLPKLSAQKILHEAVTKEEAPLRPARKTEKNPEAQKEPKNFRLLLTVGLSVVGVLLVLLALAMLNK